VEDDSLSTAGAAHRARIRNGLIVASLWLVATAVFALLAAGIETPRRAQDEFLYWALGRSLAGGLGLQWRGAEVSLYASLYPAFVSVAVRLAGGVASQFELLKLLNAAAMSAVVFPTYLLARRFVALPPALLTAVFSIAVPAMNYVGMIETEALAYPLCAAALAALVVAVAKPGVRPILGFLALTALAALTRLQFAILLPIAVACVLIFAASRARGSRADYLRSQWWLFAVAAGCFLIALVYLLLRGRWGLGIYANISDTGNFAAEDISYWLRAYAADIYLMAAFVPVVATFALLGRETRRDPLVAALALVALVATVFFVLQVTAFSALNTEHWRERHVLYERYLFYLAPLYFTGLIVALGRVKLRPALISTAVGALIVLLMPAGSIAVPYSLDAFGQAYLGYLIDDNPALETRVAPFLAVLVLLAGVAFVISTLPNPRSVVVRWGRALAVLLPLFALVLTQAKAWSYQRLYSADSRAQLPAQLDWAARASERGVAQLITAGTDRTRFHQTEFWNPNVDRVYVSSEAPVRSSTSLAPICTLAWDSRGRILPAREPGCARPPSGWLVQSDTFSLHLRDETSRLSLTRPSPSVLALTRGWPSFFAIVGGRDVQSGRVEQALELRAFMRAPGRLEITVAGRKDPIVMRLTAGEQFRRLELAGKTVTAIRLREGDKPWRSIL
jgi:hypothetical protein